MSYIEGVPRDQLILYPTHLSDVIGSDNPAHLILGFCQSVPYQKLGFLHAVPADTGRPAFPPATMLSLHIWGFMNGITSSRQLELAATRCVDVMWLLERREPDFKTISEFRRQNLDAVTGLFKAFTNWMNEQGLVSGEVVAIDGSKFRASNGKNRNYTEKTLAEKQTRLQTRIKDYLEQLERADAAEEQRESPPSLTAEQIQEAIEKLHQKKDFYDGLASRMKEEGLKQISLTDPDSRLMKTNDGMNVCYNVQIAVDSKYKLIVAQSVTNEENDEKQLHTMAMAARQALGVETLTVLADGGYVNSTEIAACTQDGITTYLPERKAKGREGRFPKSDFGYDPTTDSYTCPAGKILTHFTQSHDQGRLVHYYRTRECAGCPIRKECTSAKDGRRIARRADESVRTEAALRSRSRPDLMRQRSATVEHPFGTIKRVINRGYFQLRGLKKVSAEFALAALAYNLKRLLKIRPLPVSGTQHFLARLTALRRSLPRHLLLTPVIHLSFGTV